MSTPPMLPRSIAEGELLWTPGADFAARSQLGAFSTWLATQHQRHFADYEALWRWSVSDPDAFWSAVYDYFEIESSTPYSAVRAGEMPHTRWFPGSRINFAEHVLRYERRAAAGEVAIVHWSELRERQALTWQELGTAVRTLAGRLRALGVVPGDRVVSYMPNIPETAIAMLATTAIGAIWSSAAPEFGVRTVLDRYVQIEPKILFSVDGYRFAGKDCDRTPEVRAILSGLPTIEHVVWLPYLDPHAVAPTDLPVTPWADALAGPGVACAGFNYERVATDHPLWILFSSGTTGLPKAIVHGHVGITLEQLKSTAFNWDLKPASRAFFYCTPSWVIWNALICGLAHGASIVLFDGHPAHPEPDLLWKLAAAEGVTLFGTSPAYVQQMQKADIVPKERFDLSRLEMIFLAGSPATPEAFGWLYEKVKADLWVTSQCGSTDLCGGFLGSVATRPVYAGEIQGRALGIDVHAWDAAGVELHDEVGELVITTPCPSMPLLFWNDPGDKRYHESYFSTYPGVWRQGDFVKINRRGGAYVYGRSDATLNRFGVRIGSAEIYRCLEGLAQVVDSLVVCVQTPSGELTMPLFVKLAPGLELNATIKSLIVNRLRAECSLWHVPDQIHAVPDIPYTLTAKKMEVPVRRILEGVPADEVAAPDSMRNPDAIRWFAQFRKLRLDPPPVSAPAAGSSAAAVTAPVANAWRRTLDPQSLRADVAFADAGGDSLRLLKFVYHLEAELGRELPLELFAGASRPSEFAAALDRFLHTEQGRSDGAPRVFFFHGRDGDDPRQAGFRAACRSALDIVPLPYPDWREMARTGFDFDALVAHSLAQIERAAPTGPLRLAGYSLGGIVAYACSRVLVAAGRSVSLVVFDAQMYPARSGAKRSPLRRVANLARLLGDRQTRVFTLARILAHRLTRDRARAVLSALARVRGPRLPFDFDFYLRTFIAERLLVGTLERWLRDLQVPSVPLDIPLTLFRSAERAPSEPKDLGWRAFCSDVTVVDVAGSHTGMFDPENRAALCAAFAIVMDAHLTSDGERVDGLNAA